MNKLTFFYVPCPDKDTAKDIAKNLLTKKLIACANIFPIESMYYWKGKLHEDTESILILKAPENHAKHIEIELKDLHPFETPCIATFPVGINEEYFNWAIEGTK